MKSSFAVMIFDPRSDEEKTSLMTTVVLGVTSIMPNLNGVLLQTEDCRGVMIEHYELNRTKKIDEIFYPSKELCEFFYNRPMEYFIEDHRTDLTEF